MNTATFGIGLLIGGLLTVSVARAHNCCPGRPAAEQAEVAQAGHGGHAHDHGEEKQAPQAADAPDNEINLQTNCPIMDGHPIDRNLYVDHDGKRIYVCCQGCLDPVRNDPAKHIKALEDQGITLAKPQTACPVMGGAINRNQYVDHDGKRIYVCCQGCLAPIRRDPAKYIQKLEKEGVSLDPVPQDDAAEKDAAGHEGHRH